MTCDIQKANFGKRIAAWIFDLLFVAAIAVGCGFALYTILGYDNYNQTLEVAYNQYEGRFFQYSKFFPGCIAYDFLCSAERLYYNNRICAGRNLCREA